MIADRCERAPSRSASIDVDGAVAGTIGSDRGFAPGRGEEIEETVLRLD